MKQLDPKAVWFFFIRSILSLLIFVPIIALSFAIAPPLIIGLLNWWFLLAILVLLVLMFAEAKLAYHFERYELTEAGFRREFGIISKKYVTIPYDRIQNVDIYRGILARMLGLSDLSIQTAGSTVGAEARLPGLSREIAEEMRDELIRRASAARKQGL